MVKYLIDSDVDFPCSTKRTPIIDMAQNTMADMAIMFHNKDWKRDALKMLIDTTGTADRRPDSGRPRTVCTTAIIHQVEYLSLSQ